MMIGKPKTVSGLLRIAEEEGNSIRRRNQKKRNKVLGKF